MFGIPFLVLAALIAVPAAGVSGKLPSANQQTVAPSQAPQPCSICQLGSPR